jgi:hypothetical protein
MAIGFNLNAMMLLLTADALCCCPQDDCAD